MKDTFLKIGKGILLDGARLGTAQIVADSIRKTAKKIAEKTGLSSSEDEEDEKERRKKGSRSEGLNKFLTEE